MAQTWVSLGAWRKLAASNAKGAKTAFVRRDLCPQDMPCPMDEPMDEPTDQPMGDHGQGRTIRMVISDGTPDRSRDVIDPGGWDVTEFRRNPVVAWAHQYDQLPVARDTNTVIDGGRLLGHPQFPARGVYPFADTVHDLLIGGFLNAASVGFQPLEWTFNEERKGFDIKRAALYEWSIVPIPANPNALLEAKAAGVALAPLKTWAEQILDGTEGPGFWVSRATLEQTWKAVAPPVVTLGWRGAESDAALIEKAVPADVSRDKASEDASWSAPSLADFTDQAWTDLTDAQKRDIAGHFAWANQLPPDTYGDLKLPHHDPKSGRVVLRGVIAAAGRMNQTDGIDQAAVRAHLASHYRQFGQTPPWEQDALRFTFDPEPEVLAFDPEPTPEAFEVDFALVQRILDARLETAKTEPVGAMIERVVAKALTAVTGRVA